MGNTITTIPYHLENPTFYDTKEEALAKAKAIALNEARKKYGSDTQVSIQTSGE